MLRRRGQTFTRNPFRKDWGQVTVGVTGTSAAKGTHLTLSNGTCISARRTRDSNGLITNQLRIKVKFDSNSSLVLE